MYGKGILKGLGVTLNRFMETYLDDISWWVRGKKRYNSPEGIAHRSSKDTRGIFTVQYPEEQLLQPEEFRYIPFLLYDGDDKKDIRCTSCGICAKVCPPQCIWIVRGSDPQTGKPVSVRMALLTPTTCPLRLTRGPPELPGLIGASVWMTWGRE